MTPRRFLLASVFFWCGAIVATPLLASVGGVAAKTASLVYEIFSRVCHQLDSHSFHFAGFKFAVCVRCTSIYMAFFLGILLFPFINRTKLVDVRPLRLLIFVLAPMGIDVALAIVRIHEISTLTRILTGSIFGLGLSILLGSVLEEFVKKSLLHMHDLINTHHSRNLYPVLFQCNLQSALNQRNQNK